MKSIPTPIQPGGFRRLRSAGAILVLATTFFLTSHARAQEPDYLRDRGPGIPTSLFGTYIEEGEWLVYPFVEYTKNDGDEYKPSEIGYVGDVDYLGKGEEWEGLLFIGYGLSDRVALEFEAALYTKKTLDKAANDPSNVPARLEESGLGDVEGQVRWRWNRETASRPEYYSFVEIVLPLQKDKVLIGTQDWELGYGFGAIKGFSWGTLNARVSLFYERVEGGIEAGEFAIDYLRWTSEHWRWVASIEGESDEISLIGEAQWHVSDRFFFKFNTGIGLTEKAPDIAPEVGVMFRY